MSWQIWVMTCLLAAVAGVTTGVLFVGVKAAHGRSPVAEAGLPAPDERSTTASTATVSTSVETTRAESGGRGTEAAKPAKATAGKAAKKSSRGLGQAKKVK